MVLCHSSWQISHLSKWNHSTRRSGNLVRLSFKKTLMVHIPLWRKSTRLAKIVYSSMLQIAMVMWRLRSQQRGPMSFSLGLPTHLKLPKEIRLLLSKPKFWAQVTLRSLVKSTMQLWSNRLQSQWHAVELPVTCMVLPTRLRKQCRGSNIFYLEARASSDNAEHLHEPDNVKL